jgi:hypothetical protein
LTVLESDTLISDKSLKWRIFAATDALPPIACGSDIRPVPKAAEFAWIRRMSNLRTVNCKSCYLTRHAISKASF